MANIREVAKRSGVSVGTVSRYLNGVKIRDDNAEAIARAIEALDYHPNLIGRALTTQRTYAIGVLVASAANVFVSSSIGKLETAFEKQGYSSLFIDFHGDVDVLKEKVEFLKRRFVDGLVIFLSEVDAEHLEFLETVNIPVIVVDNPVESGMVDSIVVNNATSARKMVGAMIDAGHKRVGVIAPSQETYVGRRRLKGWTEAFESRGLPARSQDVRLCAPSKDEGFAAACSLIDQGEVTALFSCNYYLALGALKAISRRGLHPGMDIGFASFDDFDFSDVMYPSLSVIRQPMGEIIDVVASRMCSRLNGDVDEVGIQTLSCSVNITDSIRGGLQ